MTHHLIFLFVSHRRSIAGDNRPCSIRCFSQELMSLLPFGSYPNPLGLTDEDRAGFHPVVELGDDYYVQDFTRPTRRQLATEEEREQNLPQIFSSFSVGRFDEDRQGMYTSQLFSAARTIHLGIDLEGPTGTPVYAFDDGIVDSVGYNEPLGDYGHVVIVKHRLKGQHDVFALYGHLDASVLRLQVGDRVTQGQQLAVMGDLKDNGGWFMPHVHFQVAYERPSVPHDMPGTAEPARRDEALATYMDPRYILGPLY